MKNPTPRRKDGFTLVELLVVIAIIAVLAGAGFAAGNAAIQKAKRTTALSTATAIESAVNNFFIEYGSMPLNPVPATAVKTDSGNGLDLLKALLGMEATTGTMLNTRAIKFLSVKEGKANRNGLIYGTGSNPTVTGLYDPWGGPFYVILDDDYDESVTPTPTAGTAPRLNGRRAAVWSNGADGVKGGGAAGDDVKTW